MFTKDLVNAIKVQFISECMEEDSFIEKGMKAWLTKISLVEQEDDGDLYKLYFDFEDFYQENRKYFTECYYRNSNTSGLPEKPLYTAEEAGMYSHKTVVYYWITKEQDIHTELCNHLAFIGE